MGSKSIQGELWGRNAKDWASIQEQTGITGFTRVLQKLSLTTSDHLLDIGCGSGVFSNMAQQTGAAITGIDASEPLLKEARLRNPHVAFLSAEMEELPFADRSFTVVSGFNSFQYAASIQNAIAEAKRVLVPNGKLAVMVWGNREDCEAAVYLKAVGSLLPPPPPGAPGPFALSENQQLEKLLEAAGCKIDSIEDIAAIWEYNNIDTTMKGLLSAGPAAKAISHAGFEKVYEATAEAIQPFLQPDGTVIMRNKFRLVIAGNQSTTQVHHFNKTK